MGQSLANQVLMFGRPLDCTEALNAGLVSEVVSGDLKTFHDAVQKKAVSVASLPPGAVLGMKALMRDWERSHLHAVNDKETSLLQERWVSEEFMMATIAFLTRKQQ